jgi:hypothetical protein
MGVKVYSCLIVTVYTYKFIKETSLKCFGAVQR